MKTDVYKFTSDTFDISRVTDAAEKTAAYCGLEKGQAIRLVLLSEELAEMIPNLLRYGDGEFSIETSGKKFRICIKVSIDDILDSEKREKILSVSKSGRNAAAVGILNKIRIATETMLADYGDVPVVPMEYSNDFYNMGMFVDPMNQAKFWSLDKYRLEVKENENAWDELEKSIIANLADDVTVGLINGTAEIIVKKDF